MKLFFGSKPIKGVLFVLVSLLFGVACPPKGLAQSQPASMTLSATEGFAGTAGQNCYTVHVYLDSSNSIPAANMVVGFRYTFNGQVPTPPSGRDYVTTDEYGQPANGYGEPVDYCADHETAFGTYTYVHIKNLALDCPSQDWATCVWLNENWVQLEDPQTFWLRPPKPTSLTITPASNPIIAGEGQYTVTAGNGEDVTLDATYTLSTDPDCDDELCEKPHWVTLGSSGSITHAVGNCTPPGIYQYWAIKNSYDPGETPPTTGWFSPSPKPSFSIDSTPAVTNVSPSSAMRNTSPVAVTITGRNLCNVTLSANSWPGLTITNVSSSGDQVTANFNIPIANLGQATITLTALFGTRSFTFTITNNSPTITDVSPSSASPGSSGTMTITGTNLSGAELSTTASYLSWTGVSSFENGTKLTATFSVASNAPLTPPNNPPITVTNNTQASTNSATWTQFYITLLPPVLSKEYIYLGGRIIAVESPP